MQTLPSSPLAAAREAAPRAAAASLGKTDRLSTHERTLEHS